MKGAVFAVISLCLLTSQADAQCRPGWHRFRSSCYGFGGEEVTWVGAEEFCRLFDSTLAEVETSEENDFLKSLARNYSHYAVWLGGLDVLSESLWVWADSKQTLDFTDWAPGEPTTGSIDSSEDCLQLYQPHDYAWNDNQCHSWAHFVCETAAGGEGELVG